MPARAFCVSNLRMCCVVLCCVVLCCVVLWWRKTVTYRVPAAAAFRFERFEISVREQVDKNRVAVLHERGDEHAHKHVELFKVTRFGRDVFDVSRGKITPPSRAVIHLFHLQCHTQDAGEGGLKRSIKTEHQR